MSLPKSTVFSRRSLQESYPHATGRPVRSELVGADDLAAVVGGDRPPGRRVDAILDEPHRAVEERDVHPSGVIRAGADHGLDPARVDVAEIAGPLVRHHDVAV